ncbi:MAG TPA: YggT family protein [Thermoanaerobaculia bacterium]|nr:YggT family protein [Thermoanaerobaculia bacterium]
MAFLIPFFQAVLIALEVLQYLILIWVLLSWVLFFLRNSKMRWRNPRFFHILEQLDEIFSRMTYPFLRPFRRVLRRVDTAGIDWSPLLLLLTIFIVRGLIVIAYQRILRP